MQDQLDEINARAALSPAADPLKSSVPGSFAQRVTAGRS
jgi:hypothetical protein